MLQKSILTLPSKEFRLSKSFLKDVIVNIIGFIHLGFFFPAHFSKALTRSKHHLYLYTIILGLCASSTIELIQIYLPTRNSSLVDLICNISGTILGVTLFHLAYQLRHSVRSNIFSL